MSKVYDVIIIGGGPAGLSASIYASRYGLSNIVLVEELGGMAAEAFRVENYPGFPQISGLELTQKMAEHTKQLGGQIKAGKVEDIKKENNLFRIKVNTQEYLGKTIILATGSQKRKLNVPGEAEFSGKGVAFCATCDAPFFKNLEVVVVGGANSALTTALLLSQYAKKIYIINLEKQFLAEPKWQEEVAKNPKIEVIHNNTVVEIKGNQFVEEVLLKNPYNGSRSLKVQGVFIAIGMTPNNQLAQKLGVELDEKGFIKVNQDQSTNLEGVFAAGDITNGSNRLGQILTACAEGAIAATSTYRFLQEKIN
jgi:thioredoxin reductase (NADPH)